MCARSRLRRLLRPDRSGTEASRLWAREREVSRVLCTNVDSCTEIDVRYTLHDKFSGSSRYD